MHPDEEAEAQSESAKRQRKVVWTNTEDLSILAAVRRVGSQWGRIANHLPGRTPDAVRNRWHRLQRIHTLGDSEEGRAAIDSLLVASGIDPGWSPIEEDQANGEASKESARVNWSADEDRVIQEGVRKHGCKWRVIAASLPGRSDSSVRNRWMRICRDRGGRVGQEVSCTPL